MLGHRRRRVFLVLAAGHAAFVTEEASRIGMAIFRAAAGSTIDGRDR
jgi:hypothetical protein